MSYEVTMNAVTRHTAYREHTTIDRHRIARPLQHELVRHMIDHVDHMTLTQQNVDESFDTHINPFEIDSATTTHVVDATTDVTNHHYGERVDDVIVRRPFV